MLFDVVVIIIIIIIIITTTTTTTIIISAGAARWLRAGSVAVLLVLSNASYDNN